MKQQITLHNRLFPSVQSTIHSLIHTATVFYSKGFLIFLLRLSFFITNNKGSFVQMSQTYRQTEQQRNGYTC